MAFIKSRKVYAILMNDAEGKKIVAEAPKLSDDELQTKLNDFFENSGNAEAKETFRASKQEQDDESDTKAAKVKDAKSDEISGNEKNYHQMDLKERTSFIKNKLKQKGFDTSKISVRGRNTGYSDAITITVKDPNVNINDIRKLVAEYESYDRDIATGEILSGGNRFVDVEMDWETREKAIETRKPKAEKIMNDIKKQLETSNKNYVEIDKDTMVYFDRGDDSYFISYNQGEGKDKYWRTREVANADDLASKLFRIETQKELY